MTIVVRFFAPPFFRLLASRLRRWHWRERRRPEADQATALLCGELPSSRGRHSRGRRPRAPLLNTLRPITGHDRAVYTAPVRYSEGGSRAMPHPAPSPGMARVASRTLPLTRDNRGAGPLRRRLAADDARLRKSSCLRRCDSGMLAECVRLRPPRVLVDLLAPVVSALNDQAARKLIGLWAGRKVQARVGRLARKCNDGELTAGERSDYETFLAASDFVAILQALARRPLREQAT